MVEGYHKDGAMKDCKRPITHKDNIILTNLGYGSEEIDSQTLV